MPGAVSYDTLTQEKMILVSQFQRTLGFIWGYEKLKDCVYCTELTISPLHECYWYSNCLLKKYNVHCSCERITESGAKKEMLRHQYFSFILG